MWLGEYAHVAADMLVGDGLQLAWFGVEKIFTPQ